MTTEELVERFARSYFDYNAISVDRRAQQPAVLRAFAAHIDKPLVEAEGRDLRDYLSTRLAEGLAPTTLGKHLAMIRPFYGWLRQERLITADVLLDMRDVKPPRGAYVSVPRPYSEKELPRFWRDLAAHYPWTARNRGREEAEQYLARWQRGSSPWRRVAPYAYRLQVEAIVALALYGGLRQDEIYRLEIEEMHPENAYVLVRGARKNHEGEIKTRVVPWTVPAMRVAVDQWLGMRALVAEHVGAIEHDRPWLTLKYDARFVLNPMPKKRFKLLVCETGPWQYHRLRHTAATELLRAGYPLEHVKEVMGHANIAQTLRYAKLLTDDVLREARRSEGNLTARMERLRAAGGGA